MHTRSVLRLILTLMTLTFVLAACGTTLTPTPPPFTTPPPPLTGDIVGFNPQQGNGNGVLVTGFPDVASVVERVAPAVVLVTATIQTRNIFGQVVEQTSQGSGVIFDQRGHILTNNHVIEDSTRVRVTLPDRSRHDAEVIGRDPQSDLAVLKINPSNVRDMVVAPLGNTESMRIGDWVIAIGNPLGLEGSVTVGVVSAKHRQLSIDATTTLYDLVQTDAVINPGNSGGPLLNLRGEVIGINTAIIRGSLGTGQAEAEGIGFAVSMSTAIPVTSQLIENGSVRRPRLGVYINSEQVTPALAEERNLAVDHGVMIDQLIPGGGAQRAGLQPNDIIVQVEGRTINTFTDLQRLLLGEYRPGDRVSVTVVRNAVHLTFEVRLSE